MEITGSARGLMILEAILVSQGHAFKTVGETSKGKWKAIVEVYP